MSLKLVPFNPLWITHDKIDIHAIYRRPRFVEDAYGEREREYDVNGVPTWDVTGPLPVRSHNTWLNKGYEYVTLADPSSLASAARFNTLIGGTYADYNQHQTGGPWNWRKYAEGMTATTTRDAEQLRHDVELFGSAAVEAIRRQTDPHFALPAHLKEIPAGGHIETPVVVDAARPKPVPWNKGKKKTKAGPASSDEPVEVSS